MVLLLLQVSQHFSTSNGPMTAQKSIMNAGLCGIPSIWRSPTTRQPGAALDGTGADVIWLCPRADVW
jgi:hypothetical protein